MQKKRQKLTSREVKSDADKLEGCCEKCGYILELASFRVIEKKYSTKQKYVTVWWCRNCCWTKEINDPELQLKTPEISKDEETFCPFCGSVNIENMGLHGFDTMEYGCHNCHMLWDVKSTFTLNDVLEKLNKVANDIETDTKVGDKISR